MIHRLYVHNFRCLENFELKLGERSSVLLIGKNGAGKSTVGRALRILQRIARGESAIDDLVKAKDFSRSDSGSPMRFTLEAVLDSRRYEYTIAFDLPERFKKLRAFEEKLSSDGDLIFSRAASQVVLGRESAKEAKFRLDWHLAALPIIQEKNDQDPLFIFKRWLSRMVILSPIPELMEGDSEAETLQIAPDGKNFGNWFSGLLNESPSAYAKIDRYLREVLPDFVDIKNPLMGNERRSLEVRFSAASKQTVAIPFRDLSDGEKCFMICATLLAANAIYGPVVCFWDEPDNYLAISEVGHFVAELRKGFQSEGQFIATSHHAETIRKFSDESTLFLYRQSHLEPTNVRPIGEFQLGGDLVDTLLRDDVPL